MDGAPWGIRTPDTRLDKPVPWPLGEGGSHAPHRRRDSDGLTGNAGQRARTNERTIAATEVENVMLKPSPRAFGDTW